MSVRLHPREASAGQAKELTRPAALLVTGRVVGLVASFAIGIVLARMFAPATFGTYKQFFLVYGTLYGLAQLGMAESLYYFVPRNTSRTPRYVCNALITLAAIGLICLAGLYGWRTQIAARLSNAALADYMALAGLFLTFMLMSTVLEIVMVSRKKHLMAAVTYACSDIVRTLFFIVPAFAFLSLRAVFIGATAFAALRVVLVVVAIWRQYGREFRVDVALWREQLAYALPFALAVGVEVIQQNYHQYVVASRFDAATFAIYAVLRVFAETRFLLVMNLLRLAMVAALIGWFLSTFGMSGAVLVTLVSTLLVNIVGVGRIAHLLHVPLAAALPWGRLAGIFARAGIAALPVLWFTCEM